MWKLSLDEGAGPHGEKLLLRLGSEAPYSIKGSFPASQSPTRKSTNQRLTRVPLGTHRAYSEELRLGLTQEKIAGLQTLLDKSLESWVRNHRGKRGAQPAAEASQATKGGLDWIG